MLEQILGCFPDTIEHSQYKNHSIPLRQVVWIKVDCPDDSSVRALCHKILSELDSKLGFEPTKRAGTIPLLLDQIEARIKSSFLGILVIDEMQNLNLAKPVVLTACWVSSTIWLTISVFLSCSVPTRRSISCSVERLKRHDGQKAMVTSMLC